MAIVYNVQHDCVQSDCPLSLTGFMSFKRLAETLRKSGEVGPNESLRYIIITNRGLDLRYERVRTD